MEDKIKLFTAVNKISETGLLFYAETAPSGPEPPHYWVFTMTDTSYSLGILWTNYRPDAETSIRQHTTLKRDRHPWYRWDSNPQSQQAIGRRPKHLNTRTMGSARGNFTSIHSAVATSRSLDQTIIIRWDFFCVFSVSAGQRQDSSFV